MPHHRDQPPVRASVLDRLLHSDQAAGRLVHEYQIEDLVKSVRQHLEQLLNTRWRAVGPDDDLDQLRHSLINYGIPDVAATGVASATGQKMFRQRVEEAIRLHEPRFVNVAVTIEGADENQRTLHFRIEGDLHATPEPAKVVFDSQLDPTTNRIRIASTSNE